MSRQQVRESAECYTNVAPTGAGERQVLHQCRANRRRTATSVTPMSRQQVQDSAERYTNVTPIGAGQRRVFH
eukprot:5498953-Pyramimonas_sp.AAC.1